MNHIREVLGLFSQSQAVASPQLRLAFDELLDPETPPVLAAALLMALRLSGETAEVLSIAVDAVMAHSIPLAPVEQLGNFRLDTCGTGGDHASTLNISTATAFVVSAAGYPVVKHGNRSATGQSGSSEVLDSLGIRTDLSPQQLVKVFQELKFAFLFAPAFHPALKTLAPTRKLLPFRTVFNLVGPLANPARPTHQLLGVADHRLAELFAEVLQKSGVQKAAIISAQDGLDEVSLGAPTRVLLVAQNYRQELLWHPELTFGMAIIAPEAVRVNSPAESARRISAVFQSRPENAADEAYIVANSAAALWLADAVESPMEGVELARKVIKTGAVISLLESYEQFCKRQND